ncbi:MAG: nucleotidyltransferase family protein [Anaerolineales bacterium]|jgi:molybdopterin-guanine dinucleotide biosynthesis protein A|nr:nucleotidyltransferase family protein [Anaerolineales bacterium]MBP6210260.1 nucleotidyltransferase family protein [Anaerolineales bacterium]
MDAIVTAGGIPQSGDPLYAYSNGNSKALIDVAGKPMVQWILDALGESKKVDNVIVIGLTAKSGLTCKKPMHFVSNQGRMLANIVAGVNKSIELNKKSEYVLVVSSDIPALKGEMVDWLVKTAMETKDEIYYGICPQDVMEARYPTSKRTYTKLKDMNVCGADVNIIHVNQVTQHLETWEKLIGSRKSPLASAAVIGLDTLFQLFTRQLTLEAMVKRASERIGVKGRAIIWSQAEPCMDVDKPHQLEIMRDDLTQQQKKESAAAKKAARSKAKAKKA